MASNFLFYWSFKPTFLYLISRQQWSNTVTSNLSLLWKSIFKSNAFEELKDYHSSRSAELKCKWMPPVLCLTKTVGPFGCS